MHLNVICSKDWKCVSNSPETRHESAILSGGLRNLERNGTDYMLDFFTNIYNLCVYEFEQTSIIRTHNFALFAGPFKVYDNL